MGVKPRNAAEFHRPAVEHEHGPLDFDLAETEGLLDGVLLSLSVGKLGYEFIEPRLFGVPRLRRLHRRRESQRFSLPRAESNLCSRIG